MDAIQGHEETQWEWRMCIRPGLVEHRQAIDFVRQNPSAVLWDATTIISIW